MEKLINYLDIPSAEKDTVLERLSHIGFCPAYGKQKTIKKEMEKTQKGKLPQFIFAFRDDELVGYMFLIAEKEHYCKAFPWWAVGNADELPLKSAIPLLEYGISLCDECGCLILADRLKTNLEIQKQGIARRQEKECR